MPHCVFTNTLHYKTQSLSRLHLVVILICIYLNTGKGKILYSQDFCIFVFDFFCIRVFSDWFEILKNILKILDFWESSILSSTVAATTYILYQQCTRVPFSLTASLLFAVFVLFDDSHSEWCEVVSYCGFDLKFAD